MLPVISRSRATDCRPYVVKPRFTRVAEGIDPYEYVIELSELSSTAIALSENGGEARADLFRPWPSPRTERVDCE